MIPPSIYSYVESEEKNFETDEIRLGDNWNWNMRGHVQLIFHLKHGVFFTGANNYLRAFKAVMNPLIELANWTEDIEVKDIVFYIENKMGRVLSFFVKKYHDDVFVKEYDIDEYIDEITESDNAFGGVLTQKTDNPRPEVLQLNTLAFCDQTNIMGGPLAFKHYFSPDKLREMKKAGWGEDSNGATIGLEDLIVLAEAEKDPVGMVGQKSNRVTGKTIEVYILRGNLPEHYLLENDNMEKHYNQLQILAFYTDKNKKREGVTLYRKKEKEGNMMFFASRKISGRGLGGSVGEDLIHPQIWTNFLTIHKTAMLEAGSKIPLYTDDPTYSNKNKIQDMENLEITVIEDGKEIKQVPTAAPANLTLISNEINEWFEQSQFVASAFDPIIGKEPPSGTTFRGQERTVAQGRGPHDRKRGKRAKFIELVYRKWIIPDIVKKILGGQEFLATLTSEEMDWVSDQLAENHASRERNESVFNGELPEDREILKQDFLDGFAKKGNKHLLEILKDEFKGVEIKMGINVAGKQKNLADLSDKLLSIFQFVFANPQGFQQAMQLPGLANAFQKILEVSGMSQVDFASLTKISPQLEAPIEAVKPPPIELNKSKV